VPGLSEFNLEAAGMLRKVPPRNESSQKGRKRGKSKILTNIPENRATAEGKCGTDEYKGT
jgi:hypothetical protein